MHTMDWDKILTIPGVDQPLTVAQAQRVADVFAAYQAEVEAIREAERFSMRRVSVAEASGQMMLGGLIAAIEKCQPWSDDHKAHPNHVMFDFSGVPECDVQSYRGYYEHAAIGWEAPDRANVPVTVEAFLKELKLALNNTRTGYKGGEYTMHADVPVWCANYSDASGCAIVGVTQRYGTVIMHTRLIEEI